MKKLPLLLICAIGFCPMTAAALCSSDGATIVYVNGILTSQEQANEDTFDLNHLFGTYSQLNNVKIINGYNPIHLDGFGDEFESISQAFGIQISDYDLDTILSQIEPEVTTRKLLLVGHSQGSFYTNEMYDYLVAHGVPRNSIAAYNLATPADRVAGGGAYLTSANDKLINQVRVWDAQASLPQPLQANILLPLQPGDDTDPYGGHHFQTDYLAGAGARIVHDIENALVGLSADGSSAATSCFDPPSQGFSYQAQKAVFSFTDPATAGADSAANKTAAAIAAAYSSLTNAVNTAIANAVFTVIPRPTVQNAGSAFAVEKALYGSSLSEADYEALLEGDDVPEVQVSQKAPVQTAVPANPQTPAQPVQVGPKILPSSKTQPATPAGSVSMYSSISISPGYGGGSAPVVSTASGAAPANPAPSASSSSQTEPSPETSSTTTESSPTVPPLVATTTLPFTILTPADQSIFATPTVSFSGTTSAQAVIFAAFSATSASASADQEGNWEFTLGLPPGTSTISFSATDRLGNISATSTRTVGVVTTPIASSTEATSTPQAAPQVSCDQDPFAANGYFFDSSYQQVEYIDGLLRVHLKLLTPYNDGRPFRAQVYQVGTDCSVPGFDGFSPQDHPSTIIPADIQLYSFRMSSATHWILWDDENDLQLHCTICEGDISTSTLFVSFYAIVDDFTSSPSRVRSTPYRPSE